MNPIISRRRFIQTASASLAYSALAGRTTDSLDQKPKRVGLIGAGWYGKSDLCRLIQAAPVDVVSICDIDQHMLSEQRAGYSGSAGRNESGPMAESSIRMANPTSPIHGSRPSSTTISTSPGSTAPWTRPAIG
jgi:hypothetical protein